MNAKNRRFGNLALVDHHNHRVRDHQAPDECDSRAAGRQMHGYWARSAQAVSSDVRHRDPVGQARRHPPRRSPPPGHHDLIEAVRRHARGVPRLPGVVRPGYQRRAEEAEMIVSSASRIASAFSSSGKRSASSVRDCSQTAVPASVLTTERRRASCSSRVRTT